MKRRLIDPRDYQPALPIPHGYSLECIRESLATVSLDGGASDELRGYAIADCERFIHTLALIPEGASGKLVEVGANPYFTTLLIRHFRPKLQISLVNYFGRGFESGSQTLVFPGFENKEETVELNYENVNIEEDSLPFADDEFDFLLFCEVIEHMTNDPLHALIELKRVIKSGGHLILTTPNVARLETIVAFIEGRNAYDQYSGHGPYGRHNREYTRHELHSLLRHCGFEEEVFYTANVHSEPQPTLSDAAAINKIIAGIRHREYDLGQYMFTRWRNAGPAEIKLPRWLYRSYPAERMMA